MRRNSCQRHKLVPKYRIIVQLSISTLSDVIPIDFAGPFPPIRSYHKFILVAVKHLTGWLVIMSTSTATILAMIQIMKKRWSTAFYPLICCLRRFDLLPGYYITNNSQGGFFQWKPVFVYTSISIEKDERMIGTSKKAMAPLITNEIIAWDKVLAKLVYQ